MIRTLIVDDSATQRQLLRQVLADEPEFKVVGEAADGLEAVEMCLSLEPDLVTMDIQMPRMNGYEAIQRIMSESPRPIVVLTSSMSDRELGISFKALEHGALMVLGKPTNLSGPAGELQRLRDQLKAMAGVRVVGRRRDPNRPRSASPPRAPIATARPRSPVGLICLGASTGGPPALQTILRGLDPEKTPPIAVVQHINPGFVQSLASWLGDTTGFQVKPATAGERLLPGKVLLAPEGKHLVVARAGRADLMAGAAVNGHCPSVTALFRSAATAYGQAAVGVLLTGMGRDGAQGLYEMRQSGARTIAQDKQSSVVWGMPGEAVALGAAADVLPLSSVAPRLRALCTLGKSAFRNKD
ncbi:MAG: chemotaxis-specific protein-glutamate methyltransferase CheB [Desulfarculaceae bacterium]|nr:chemotaxis-specific protein-glutamate methyltransferase CheB [Desulfarculaceae bacterium]MCF8072818.1 chemotaxis-specific protein-glutamate methyltransferase CheB [Desulfarculaceae bacterium]MCF8100986.1 chemotaxis-specific protein-glutamate methyltransferase CheB [Desulfarculaceae bacterium]MCF8115627.1 chemotaxis-specific protein-glutamate methyltransferase CheB [Desulfarculaceae bacterium]